MKRKTAILNRAFSLLLILSMMVGLFAIAPGSVKAADVTKVEKSYDIAVAFDNSGSMYNDESWCRAKYAMEIFASMLNYDKDKLHIFPMWEVVTDGSRPKNGGSVKAIEISSKADIDKISYMFTVTQNGTPFAPVTEAYNYLKASSADEKWLIVLTDGEFNRETRDGGLVSFDLENRLSALASSSIKVQYLGFAGATPLSGNEARNFFAKNSTDTSLKDDLIGICNTIFQRSVLPDNRLKGEKLSLDLSMKNVIVFAQGANAKILSLKDSAGNEIAISLDSGQRKYSEYSFNNTPGNTYPSPVDRTLAGQVVTFAACPKGEYTLSYTDADKIQIFYEPDVDIDVSLVNSDGQRFDGTEELAAGEYTVVSRIVDATTGEDVTNHELMGNATQLKTYIKTSKDSDYKEYANGAKIEFEPDAETELYIEGEYLGKYKITSKDSPNLAWLKGFVVVPPGAALTVDAKAGQTWFTIKDHETWKAVKVTLTLDGAPLTDEQLAAVQLTVTPSRPLKCRYEAIPGESAFYIFLAQDENGTYTEPETGRYKLKVSAIYTDEYGKEAKSNSDSVSFEIQTYAQIWRVLIWVLGAVVLFVLWLLYMLQKVLPKNIVKETASFSTMTSGDLDATFADVEYRRKGKSLSIVGSAVVEYDEQCSATFDIRPVDNHFTRPTKRRIAITGIDSICDEVKIAGVKYVKYEGQWLKATDLRKAETGKSVPSIDQTISCNPRFELSRSGLSTLSCKTKTSK